ncbi:fatty acyl-AMP ligase [Kitasatospora purpeofusca]|uniref:fatty acyl-AMP ligase n=1 Tax=Kitasatospora purpeofusca TaxID=67352 RepID=UPI0036E8B3FD
MGFDITGYPNLGEALAARVALQPEQTAVTFHRGSTAAAHESLTYRELGRRVGLRAAALAARMEVGDRLLIALPTCPEFVELYLACLTVGVVAVPSPPVTASSSAAKRVAAMAKDCRPALVITTEGDVDTVAERLRHEELDGVPVEATVPVGEGEADPTFLHGRTVDGDTLAVLQYSSGSTGAPKGVMLAHRNIQANLAGLNTIVGLGHDDAFAAWLPLHHDFGLFVQLTFALFYGAPTVLMAPSDFARRPLEWLRMMDEFRTTATSAPNFAYELATRLITDEQMAGLDLSRLRFVCNGSEPIHAPTMAAFAKRFAAVGLRPEALTSGYGMAEVTVYVSNTPLPEPQTVIVADANRLHDADRPALVATAGGEGREVVGVGTPRILESRIVDPLTRQVLPEGSIGEVWLSGPSVADGYWEKPELNDEVFRARPAGDDGTGPVWLRTGDLGGFVDGELFITGRLKEVLIVNGRNLYPQDLEHEARSTHQALTGFVGAAFSVEAPDERVVLVHEVGPRVPAEDLPGIATAVSRRLAASFGVPVRNVLLVRRGQVRRTTSGKIERGTMRRSFLAGGIETLHAELEPEVRRLVGTAVGAP